MRTARRFLVVVGSDGSPGARAAVEAALAFPWPAGSEALGVVARGRALRPPGLRAGARAALEAADARIADELRAALRRRWPGARVALDDRPPARALVAAARGDAAIVVGSRGRGAVRGALLGSVSRAVVRTAAVPVLVVKGLLPKAGSFAAGVDGSENARRVVAFLARLDARRARVLCVSVVEPVTASSAALMPGRLRQTLRAEVARLERAQRAAARRELEAARAALEKAGFAVRTRLEQGRPLEVLLAAAAGSDVLAIGARGTSGVERLLLGSVADRALARSPVSVLVVR